MEMKFEGRRIIFTRELSKLDDLALYFSDCLNTVKIENVFLSGYVAILFGRNRQSEGVNCICTPITFEKFMEFWEMISKDLECIITSNIENAYHKYLKTGTALRFSKKVKFIPNVEMKFATTEMHRKALSDSLEVIVNNRRLNIAPLEQQIAFKLYMGSEKDIEDARFLFKLFEENLDKITLITYLEALDVSKGNVKTYLGWSF